MNSEPASFMKASPTVWTGRVLSLLLAGFLIFSGVMKLQPVTPEVEEGLQHVGISTSLLVPLAVVEIISAVLFVIPQTMVVGAILLTGYMGGAICTHLRVGDPFVVQAAIPILVWVAAALREPSLWSLIPWRR